MKLRLTVSINCYSKYGTTSLSRVVVLGLSWLEINSVLSRTGYSIWQSRYLS